MGFVDNDHAIRELIRFIEMTSRGFIFEYATRNGGQYLGALRVRDGKGWAH